MKVSNYNFIYEVNDKYYALNLLSGGLIEIDDINVKEVLLHNKLIDDISTFKKEDIEILKKGNFILEKEMNEMDLIKLRYRKNKYNNEVLKITIIPTYKCNFNCTYCYQKHLQNFGFMYSNDTINEEILDALEIYLKGATINKNHLHIEWFGGEPTLASDIIIEFNYKIKDICEENDCIFTSSIVTNGYLLDEKLGKRLNKSGIRSALITVDGPKNIHDERRILKNGMGTYDTILRNIVNVSRFMKISLRINIDKQNNNHIMEFIEQLKNMNINRNNIKVIIVPTIFNENNKQNEIDRKELVNCLEDIYSKLIECDLNCKIDNIFDNTSCAAKKNNVFILDVDGRIFKCSSLTGHANLSDGKLNLATKQIEMNYNGARWMTWEPFDKKECCECKFLPICYGGCIYNNFIDKQKIDETIPKHMIDRNMGCKDYYDEFLKLLIKQYIYISNKANKEVV